MKFRMKITVCMVWLLALAFGLGGGRSSRSISPPAFSGRRTRLSAPTKVLNTLRVVDELGQAPDHSNLTEALGQMDSQGVAGLSALRLGYDDQALYEEIPGG